MSKINAYTIFQPIRHNGKNAVVVEETEEYFENGDIITVSEYHFATIRGNEFGWARVKSDAQHRKVLGNKELLEKFQLLTA